DGGAVTVTFQVTVDDPAAPGAATISNTAQVSATDVPEFSTEPADITLDASPSVSVTKTAMLQIDNGSAGVGNPRDVIRYTVTVTNSGNQGVANLSVDDTAPANTTLQVGSVSITDDVAAG